LKKEIIEFIFMRKFFYQRDKKLVIGDLMYWNKRHPPRALTIAGSDSGGGAGIQADLKTFLVHGVYGMSAITSITAQNTVEVREIFDIPPEMVARQIEAVVDDIGVDAAKTGMLSTHEIVNSISSVLNKYDFPLVVDPVMVAKNGARLLKEDAVDALKKKIFPRADIVTPNRMEAEVLSGIGIRTLEDAKKAALIIHREYSPKAVVVKGGHIESNKASDVVFFNGEFHIFTGPWIEDGCTHGTGCSFSAAIASNLAWGNDVLTSIRRAKEFISHSIANGLKIGRGHCPVNSASWLEIPAERYKVLTQLNEGIKILTENSELFSEIYPEVGINLVMSLPYWYAKGPKDVAGFPGRIVMVGEKLVAPYPPSFGASKHMAKAVLTIMKFDSSKRSGMNILYIEGLEKAIEKTGMVSSYFDRSEEPPDVKATEGATTPWGIETAVKRAGGSIPDVVIDRGGFGKEPLAFIFGTTPTEVVSKVMKISKALS
jgi:hydroxymethylpyrimidine/phosphomethylpyrimidine kinase